MEIQNPQELILTTELHANHFFFRQLDAAVCCIPCECMNACQDKIDLWTLTLTVPNYQQMVGFEGKNATLSPPPLKNQEILNSFDALSVHIVCRAMFI